MLFLKEIVFLEKLFAKINFGLLKHQLVWFLQIPMVRTVFKLITHVTHSY